MTTRVFGGPHQSRVWRLGALKSRIAWAGDEGADFKETIAWQKRVFLVGEGAAKSYVKDLLDMKEITNSFGRLRVAPDRTRTSEWADRYAVPEASVDPADCLDPKHGHVDICPSCSFAPKLSPAAGDG